MFNANLSVKLSNFEVILSILQSLTISLSFIISSPVEIKATKLTSNHEHTVIVSA